jgi:L-fuconolactonase
VDAHVHLWDLAVRAQPWTEPFPVLHRSFLVDELRAVLRRHGVAAAIAVQAGDTTGETLDLLALADGEPVLAGVVGWVDLTAPDPKERLARLREAPGGARLVGVRHQLQVEPDAHWLAREQVRTNLGELAEHDLLFDVVVSAEQLPLVVETVRATPGTRFVLDHAGKPPLASGDLHAWRRDVAELAQSPNVAVKLSGLVTEAGPAGWSQHQLQPVIEHVLDCFGPYRTMAGSDWPVCLLAADYGAVQTTLKPALDALGEAGQAAVLGGTARHWYLRESS